MPPRKESWWLWAQREVPPSKENNDVRILVAMWHSAPQGSPDRGHCTEGFREAKLGGGNKKIPRLTLSRRTWHRYPHMYIYIYIYYLKPVPTIQNLMLFNIYIYHISVFSWSFLIPLVMPFFSKGCSWDATALARWSTVSDTCEAFNSQTGRWELTLQALLRCFRQIECDQCRHILWWYGGPMAYSYIIYEYIWYVDGAGMSRGLWKPTRNGTICFMIVICTISGWKER